MRSILYAVMILAVAAALLSCAPIESPERDPAISAEELTQLRGCAPMQIGDPNANCVSLLQNVLRERGAAIESTSTYGPWTTEAVRQFQEARTTLRRDGAVDEATLSALTDLPSGDAEWDLSHDCVSLRRDNGDQGRADSEGECVAVLRNRLKEYGAILPDGYQFDEDTDVAVRAFQISAGLGAEGIVGPATKKALYQPLPEDQQMVASNCELSGCAIYLTRHLTNNLAAASNNKPARNAIIAALTVLPCRRVKALSLDALCQAVASYVIDKAIEATGVVEKAQRASSQKACLVVNLGYSESNTSWSPLSVDVYNGPKCRD